MPSGIPGRLVLRDYIPDQFTGSYESPLSAGLYGPYDSSRLGPGLPSHLPNPGGFPTTLTLDKAREYATSVMMRSNPSKPWVNLPTFIAELRELPRSIRDQGRKDIDAAKRSGANSSAVHYGIIPLVSDVLKLTYLSEQVDRRVNELRQMRKEGGYRNKVWIMKTDHRRSITPNLLVNGRTVSFGGGFHVKDTFNAIWGVIRWEVDSSQLPPSGSDEERKLIKATLQGMTSRKNLVSYLSDVWELMPWSWLGDWAGNMGDYLQAYGSSLPARPSQLHIMQKVSTQQRVGPFLGNLYFNSWHEQKYRFKATPSISLPSLFLLSTKQMSILSGIGLSRRGRRNPA